jgi:hypothetical protein
MERYGSRLSWMDHPVLAMVPRAYPNVRLIVHKPGLRPVDHTPNRTRICRLLNVPGHFKSLRPRSELGGAGVLVACRLSV